MGVEAFGLEEELVGGLVGEADDLVLDGGAVARADGLDLAGVHGAAVDVLADQAQGLGVVRAMWQEIWRSGGDAVCGSERKLKGVGSVSPGWSSNLVQSMVRPSRRGGVPVLRRVSRRPSFFRDSPRRTEAGSPERPAVYCCSPQWMRPLRKVPVVTMTAWAAILRPSRRRTPVMRGGCGAVGSPGLRGETWAPDSGEVRG